MDKQIDGDSYQQGLRQAFDRHKAKAPGASWKKLASQVPVQYTYLSRVLNSETQHLSADHVFRLASLMGCTDIEIECLLLRREIAASENLKHRQFLKAKLERLERSPSLKQTFLPEERRRQEAQYLSDPMAVVIHVALDLKEYRQAPTLLCQKLGITRERLKSTLILLESLDFIKLSSDDPFQIREYSKNKFHFGKDHHLMRAHQHIMRSVLAAHLNRVDEHKREGFLVTFTGDEASFQEIRKEFNSFLKRVEGIADKSQHKHVLQLNFEMFQWT